VKETTRRSFGHDTGIHKSRGAKTTKKPPKSSFYTMGRLPRSFQSRRNINTVPQKRKFSETLPATEPAASATDGLPEELANDKVRLELWISSYCHS
jgi:hypothetical protein